MHTHNRIVNKETENRTFVKKGNENRKVLKGNPRNSHIIKRKFSFRYNLNRSSSIKRLISKRALAILELNLER